MITEVDLHFEVSEVDIEMIRILLTLTNLLLLLKCEHE